MECRWVVTGAGAASVLAVLFLAPGLRAAANPRGEITAAVDSMRAALQRGDARSLAGFYTEDAELVSTQSFRGRAAIEGHMADIMAKGVHDVRLEDQEVFPGDGYTVETGRSLFFLRNGARIAVVRYMTLWKKTPSGWQIHRDLGFPVSVDASAVAELAGNASFAVKETAPFRAIVLPMTGPYSQHGDAIARLGLWFEASKVKPLGPAFGRYFNSVEDVSEAALAWEVGFPVPQGTTAAPPFEVRDIADGTVVYAIVGGPHDSSRRPWPELGRWVAAHKHQPVGPAMEIWQDGPQTEMRLAVRAER